MEKRLGCGSRRFARVGRIWRCACESVDWIDRSKRIVQNSVSLVSGLLELHG